MSSYRIGLTSTTPSLTCSHSRSEPPLPAESSPSGSSSAAGTAGGSGGSSPRAGTAGGSGGSSPRTGTAVVACGAVGGLVREAAARRGWHLQVHALPALLHNRPASIAPAARRL